MLRNLWKEAMGMTKKIGVPVFWEHIPRAENAVADWLAGQARRVRGTVILSQLGVVTTPGMGSDQLPSALHVSWHYPPIDTREPTLDCEICQRPACTKRIVVCG